MRLIAGIDAGGSHLRLIIGSADPAGSGSPVEVEVEAEQPADLGTLLAEATGRLGGGPSDVVAVVVGCAGGGTRTVRSDWQATVRRLAPGAAIEVTGDDRLPLPALGVASGVVVIAGTGAAVSVVTADGHRVPADGWGPSFGDLGSGFDLGRRAIQSGLRALDGSEPDTGLADLIATSLGLDDLRRVAEATSGGEATRRAVAGLAPVVIEASGAGDPIAATIVTSALDDLAGSVRGALARSGGTTTSPVALAGGLLTGSDTFRAGLVERLVGLGLAEENVAVVRRPVVGAFRLAAELVETNPRPPA